MKKVLIVFSLLFLLTYKGGHCINQNKERGAFRMPYVRYEADKGICGGGARIKGPSFKQEDIASEASAKSYIELQEKGSFVKWSIKNRCDGLTLRFTIPDSEDGNGLNGKLAFYINQNHIKDIELTSRYAWQYFYKQQGKDYHPHNNPKIGNPRMRFDEIRIKLPFLLKQGDELMLKKDGDDKLTYGIDFIEVEKIDAVIAKPEGYIDVTQSPFNAIANDGKDDYLSFVSAVKYAYNNGLNLYISPGKFLLSGQINLDRDSLKILGAGIWHTHIHFTTAGNKRSKSGGGINANGSNLEVSDFYMSSAQNYRGGYRAFGQYWGKNSSIKNIWLTHFSVGFWIADYRTKQHNSANGLTISNCRIRNTYADGLNFAKGSSYCTLEHSNIRNTGDDAMASWSSNKENVGPNTANIFRFNTVEFATRAAGAGIFGGQKHKVHNCLFIDNFAGAGIRVNSTFEGWNFPNDSFIEIYDNTIIRCGTSYNLWNRKIGAIDINVRHYDVRNIQFRDIDIINSQSDGILVKSVSEDFGLTEVHMQNVKIHATGIDNLGPSYGISISQDVNGWIKKTNVTFRDTKAGDISNNSSSFNFR